jgi:hypothetical protein
MTFVKKEMTVEKSLPIWQQAQPHNLHMAWKKGVS